MGFEKMIEVFVGWNMNGHSGQEFLGFYGHYGITISLGRNLTIVWDF